MTNSYMYIPSAVVKHSPLSRHRVRLQNYEIAKRSNGLKTGINEFFTAVYKYTICLLRVLPMLCPELYVIVATSYALFYQ